MEKLLTKIIGNMKFLHQFRGRLIGWNDLFVYWDRKASVLEFYIFGKVYYFWVNSPKKPVYKGDVK